MKNLKNLGEALNKSVQKAINGGARKGCGACSSNSDCGSCNDTAFFQEEWICFNNFCISQ